MVVNEPLPAPMIEALRRARSIAVLTGAGISAESGIPTFRDAQTGLWARFRPEELATAEAFRRNPTLVWDWYAWRRSLVSAARPNAGHRALAEMERRSAAFTLITQNVDGLHALAGSVRLIELHGSIVRDKCFAGCGYSRQADPEPAPAGGDGDRPPRCPNCSAPLRPDVVWFGEALPQAALEAADEAARGCDAFLSIGTSAVVFPAAQLPLSALEAGATVIEMNRDPTPLSAAAHFSLRGAAGEVLPRLLDAVWPRV
jgi:NAD-dependent deacetylase